MQWAWSASGTRAPHHEPRFALQEAPGFPGVVEYFNTTTPVATIGAEAELRKEWKDGWMASASYSYQRSRYLKDDTLGSIVTLARDPTRRDVPNAPEHLASRSAAARPFLGLRLLLAMTRVSFTGARYDRNDTAGTVAAPTPPQQKTDPAVIWDLVLSGHEPLLAPARLLAGPLQRPFDCAVRRCPVEHRVPPATPIPQPGRGP